MITNLEYCSALDVYEKDRVREIAMQAQPDSDVAFLLDVCQRLLDAIDDIESRGRLLISHPLLRKPKNAAVFADLRAYPCASMREWADRWKWTKDRVHRFLHALVRAGLVELTVTINGTLVTFPDVDADSTPTRADRDLNATPEKRDASETRPRRVAALSHPPLASLASCFTRPSKSFPQTAPGVDVIDYGGEEGTYTEKLIRAMNKACRETFGKGHRTIQPDNIGSNRAGPELEAEGVPIEFAVEQLVLGVRRFNVGKHGKGSLPRTVAYFAPGISEKWSQPEFALLSMESRKSPKQPVPVPEIPEKRGTGAVPVQSAVEAYMEGQLSRRRG